MTKKFTHISFPSTRLHIPSSTTCQEVEVVELRLVVPVVQVVVNKILAMEGERRLKGKNDIPLNLLSLLVLRLSVFVLYSDPIPTFNVKDVIAQLLRSFVNDFRQTFVFVRNGTIRCTNADHPIVRGFFTKWHAQFVWYGFTVRQVNLVEQGQGAAGLEVMNRNKQEMILLYGLALQLYVDACRQLGEQPDPQYVAADLMNIDLN